MTSYADGGSSRVSIPHHLRKTIQSIREITGKQHSDEDIFAVYKESFNDPHETAQKLLYLDTFHEVKSKREKKKEIVVPVTQGSGRSGRRNFASSNPHHDAANGRNASFKRENGANHVAGGSRIARPATNKARNFTGPRAIKVSGSTSVPNGVNNHKAQDDIAASVNNGPGEKLPLSKPNSSSEGDVVSEPVAAPVSVSVVHNHIQDVPSAQISQPVVDNQPEEFLTFTRQDPSLISASRCSSQSDQVTKNENASTNGKTQSLLKSDVGERSHVTFPFHLQVPEVLQTGLTFGSFDSNFVKEVSNNGASGGDDSNLESSYGTRTGDSSPATNAVPEVASVREGASSVSEDNTDHGISNSAPGAEPVRHPDHIVLNVEDERNEEALPNTQTQQIAYGQEAPFSIFGLVPSLPVLGQPVNTESAETQPGNSNAQAISLASYPPEHLFRQQYPPHFYPYGPYYSPYYMPPPYYHHQFLSPNGIPQQSYFPPGATLSAPSPIEPPQGNTENPPTTNPSPHAYSSVATTLNSLPNSENTTPLTENAAAAWIGQGLGNMQVNPMYNLALPGQPFGFPVGNGGLMGIHQPTQPMAVASTTYQTFPPPPPQHTTTAMAEPIGHPHMGYQQSQANWVNNY